MLLSVNTYMYYLTLEYPDSTSDMMRDINTFAFATDLLLRGIYCDQPDECTLVFDSEQDSVYASLLYTGSATTTLSKAPSLN